MSLVDDVEKSYTRLAAAGPKVSALVRLLKGRIPVQIYDDLLTELCGVAAGTNELKIALGVARMVGEVEQRPPPVTTERLELAACMPLPRKVDPFPAHAVEAPGPDYWRTLRRAGDDTLQDAEENDDPNVRVAALGDGSGVARA